MFVKPSDDGFLLFCNFFYRIEAFLLHLIKNVGNKKIIYTIFNYYKVIKSNDEESSNLQKL